MKGPPFDGKPCPACPTAVRALFVAADRMAICARVPLQQLARHEAVTELHDAAIPEQSFGPFAAIRTAAILFLGRFRRDYSPSSRPELWEETEALTVAVGEARALVDRHYADKDHSHGGGAV